MTKLTIIQQNDTHGSLDLHQELFWVDNTPQLKPTGGFPRIAKYIKDLKAQGNVLFLDGGDLFHGTLPLVSSRGEALLPALEKMQLDGYRGTGISHLERSSSNLLQAGCLSRHWLAMLKVWMLKIPF